MRFVYLIEMEPPNIPNLITYSYVCLLLLNVLFDALASLLMKDKYTAFAIPSTSWHCQQMSCVYTLSACILPLLHEPILLSFQPFVTSDSIQHPSDSSGLSKNPAKHHNSPSGPFPLNLIMPSSSSSSDSKCPSLTYSSSAASSRGPKTPTFFGGSENAAGAANNNNNRPRTPEPQRRADHILSPGSGQSGAIADSRDVSPSRGGFTYAERRDREGR